MSSFQKFSLGIVLLGIAFVFGKYMTNQSVSEQAQAGPLGTNDPSSLHEKGTDQSVVALRSPLTDANNRPTLQQSLRDRIMGKRKKMTPKNPPLALSTPRKTPSPFFLPSGTNTIIRSNDLAEEPDSVERVIAKNVPKFSIPDSHNSVPRMNTIDEIVVPDFSKLDALVANTHDDSTAPPRLLPIDRSNSNLIPPRVPHNSTDIVVGAMSNPDEQPARILSSPKTDRLRSGPGRIPFGLTDKAKNELVKIQYQNSISFANSKFVTHRTVDGDTLHSLSQKFYGKPDFYLDIYLANQNLLENPSSVPTGITVKIPVLDQ